MTITSVSHLIAASGSMGQEAAYQPAPIVEDQRTFTREIDRLEATKRIQKGQPLDLVKKEALATRRTTAPDLPETQGLNKTAAVRDLTSAEEATRTVENSDFGFWDLVDLINPLQHLPLIGTIYRQITGDEIKPEVQVAGSILMGAATGSILMSAASGVASVILEEHTGKEPGALVAEALLGKDREELIDVDSPYDETIQFADAEMIDPDLPAEVYIPGTMRTYIAERQGQEVEPAQPVQQAAAEASAPTQVQAQASTATELLLKEQEMMQRMANPASPDFVHEFMMNALDKYQTAHRQGTQHTRVQ